MSTTPEDCTAWVTDGFAFPRRPVNRAALARIDYRVGEYPDLVESMLRRIDREVALAGWTHREADDPGIALLEGAAILGDILTFYQERYANEAYLRTATWRESIVDLVRLTGYRPAPALGGRGTLAVVVRGGRPVVVPAGWPVKADLEGSTRPMDAETTSEVIAWPHLSRFNLYRPRHHPGFIVAGERTVEVATVDGSDAPDAVAAPGLRAGDHLMLLAHPPSWESGGTSFTTDQEASQVLEVEEVRQVLGRTLVVFTGPVDRTWPGPVAAYRIGRTFRHAGHAVPPTYTSNVVKGGEITGARQHTTGYLRHVYPGHDCAKTSADRDLPAKHLPLAEEIRDLLRDSSVIVEARINSGSTVRDLTVLRTVSGLRHTSMGFASWTGPVTILHLQAALLKHQGLAAEADIRDYRVHEVTGPALSLAPRATGQFGPFGTGTEALRFYGTAAEAAELAGRRLTLVRDSDGSAQTLAVVNARTDFSGGAGARMWPVSFDAPPAFDRGEFDEEAPAVSVLGNLVEISEGKRTPATVLGTGDARALFQTFPVGSPPTHHLLPGASPPHVPELTVYVAGSAWTRVPSLFGQPPDAEVYVVREDAEGSAWVQFGDGVTGARLPSGVGNVSATWRTGAGSRGPLKPDLAPTAAERIAAVTKLALPEGIHGGTDRESGDHAREAAPGKVQGLGRLVSLADYETELLTLPGVVRVRARWDIVDAVPAVLLLVLLDRGREAEFEAVRAIVNDRQRCTGPDRFPLIVRQAFHREAYVDVRYGLDPRRLRADVESDIVAALAPRDAAVAMGESTGPSGITGDPGTAAPRGLFDAPARTLGGPEYASTIEGVVQGVDGVTFVQVTAFGLFTAAESRSDATLALPTAPRALQPKVVPARDEVLSLTRGALTLLDAAPDVPKACP
ncbi:MULTISPECIES: hypothetical protein [Citricoccus]|uniref:hypothetical protein n=1 Tax=Citricoccus TaxID=169133 RepID=UPI000255F130|nr:hypothetical protein [Citricoccus sp. CH26A]